MMMVMSFVKASPILWDLGTSAEVNNMFEKIIIIVLSYHACMFTWKLNDTHCLKCGFLFVSLIVEQLFC